MEPERLPCVVWYLESIWKRLAVAEVGTLFYRWVAVRVREVPGVFCNFFPFYATW